MSYHAFEPVSEEERYSAYIATYGTDNSQVPFLTDAMLLEMVHNPTNVVHILMHSEPPAGCDLMNALHDVDVYKQEPPVTI